MVAARSKSESFGSKLGMNTKSGSLSQKYFGSKGGMGLGKTGTFSGKNLRQAQRVQQREQVDQIVDLFKKDSSFLDVQNKMGRNALGSIDVKKEFQTAQFYFNPMGQLTTKGWELKIPENFKKVDGRYVAPSVEYTKEWMRSGTGKGKRKEMSKSSYIPTEIILDKSGKIDKIIKRGDYQDFEVIDDDYRKWTRKVYEKEVQDYEGDFLQSKKVYNPYEIEKERDRDADYKRTKRGVYLQEDVDYGPYGRKMTALQYSPYEADRDIRKSKAYDQAAIQKALLQTSADKYKTSWVDLSKAKSGTQYKQAQDVLRRVGSKVYSKEESEYKTALKAVQYYDEWGQPLETMTLW